MQRKDGVDDRGCTRTSSGACGAVAVRNGVKPGVTSAAISEHLGLRREDTAPLGLTGPRKVVHLMCTPRRGLVLQESGGAGVVGMELLIGDGSEHP